MRGKEDEPLQNSMFYDGDGPPGCSEHVYYAEATGRMPRNVIPIGDLKYIRIAREFRDVLNRADLSDPDPHPAA